MVSLQIINTLLVITSDYNIINYNIINIYYLQYLSSCKGMRKLKDQIGNVAIQNLT